MSPDKRGRKAFEIPAILITVAEYGTFFGHRAKHIELRPTLQNQHTNNLHLQIALSRLHNRPELGF